MCMCFGCWSKKLGPSVHEARLNASVFIPAARNTFGYFLGYSFIHLTQHTYLSNVKM